MEFWKGWVQSRKLGLLAFAVSFGIWPVFFVIYHFPMEALEYPCILQAAAGAAFFGMDAWKEKEKEQALKRIRELTGEEMNQFPKANDSIEKNYQEIIEKLFLEEKELLDEQNARYEEMADYYTTWVHQIKTPIAAMHLQLGLGGQDAELTGKMEGELQRIEQYVEMALCYVRLSGEANDYVIRRCSLDKIVGQVLKKLSGQFFRRKLELDYTPSGKQVLTDEKWLAFVVEQVLTNALKYTPSGKIRIFAEEPETLCIQDTGIGILPEDLPRICEKGYTGCNGRADKKASGIGLYLCRRICRKLGHEMKISSVPGKGTVVRLFLEEKKLEVE